MKILVFEYITGGGFNRQELPDSLVREGRLMLQALLDNLSRINGIELMVMLDWRLKNSIDRAAINTRIIKREHNSHNEFVRLCQHCDAIWPIAPEFNGILQSLCHTVETMGKLLLTSATAAVAVTGNKFHCYQHLSRHYITTIPTQLLDDKYDYLPGEWMIKPVDGAGCADSYLISNRQEFMIASTQLQGRGQFIIQPHIRGKKTSLSCLFKQGQGWLICANLQRFNIVNKQYRLAEIVVNTPSNLTAAYKNLVNKIAGALPDLWGYVGIDLIETTDQINVLEINPRLTTSFAGIYAACGINIAQVVLQLIIKGKPLLNPTCDHPVIIRIK